MTDETPSSDDTTPDLEPAPAPPTAAQSADTVEVPAATQTPKIAKFSRPRQLMAAGAAGLLVVGGLAGFGIGRATGGDDGPRFTRNGQFRPGQQGYGRPGQRGPGGGGFGGGQGNGPQQAPGQSSGQSGGQSNGQSGGQSSNDGPGSDGT